MSVQTEDDNPIKRYGYEVYVQKEDGNPIKRYGYEIYVQKEDGNLIKIMYDGNFNK